MLQNKKRTIVHCKTNIDVAELEIYEYIYYCVIDTRSFNYFSCRVLGIFIWVLITCKFVGESPNNFRVGYEHTTIIFIFEYN